mgnify:CR=1 FL=1
MKLLLGVTLIGLLVQTPTLSPLCVRAQYLAHTQQQPGNPGHRAPPENFYCETNHVDAAKRCACHRVDPSELCEGEPIEDNAQCLVACHKNHCHCLVECKPGATSPGEAE